MRITVTQMDISTSLRHSPDYCAVANALRRAGIKHNGVIGSRFVVGVGGTAKDYPLSIQVREWISKFDSGEHVEPFSFDLPYEFVEPETPIAANKVPNLGYPQFSSPQGVKPTNETSGHIGEVVSEPKQ